MTSACAPPFLAAAVAALTVATLGCSKESTPASATASPSAAVTPAAPAAPSAAASPCASGGGEVKDPVSAPFFPRAPGDAAGFCIDPEDHVRSYGDRAKLSMDEVCTQAFDGECEVYKRFGLKRVVFVRYLADPRVKAGPAAAGSVEIYVSEFKDAAGAYGMFTKRVVADGDPARFGAPRPLAAGGAGAIGTGRAYVWRGAHVVELQYNDDQESEEQLRASSTGVLSALAKGIGDRLPGSVELPALVRALPEAQRLPGGVELVDRDALGVPNLGPAAIGYYKDGDKRFRTLALSKEDGARAADLLKTTVRSRPGVAPLAGVGEEAVAVALPGGEGRPKSEYVFARKGAVIVAVGDEPLAVDPGAAADKVAATRLTKEEKVARLKAALASAAAAVTAPKPAASK